MDYIEIKQKLASRSGHQEKLYSPNTFKIGELYFSHLVRTNTISTFSELYKPKYSHVAQNGSKHNEETT